MAFYGKMQTDFLTQLIIINITWMVCNFTLLCNLCCLLPKAHESIFLHVLQSLKQLHLVSLFTVQHLGGSFVKIS